jgi:hypothetical protein
MGLNGGLQDAANLSKKLSKVMVGGAPDRLLDLYSLQRRTVSIEFVQQQTIATRDRRSRSGAQSGRGCDGAPEGRQAAVAHRRMPVGVKDVIENADMPTGMGSPLFEGWRLILNHRSSGRIPGRFSSGAGPKPFIWSKSASKMLEKVARAKQVLESQHDRNKGEHRRDSNQESPPGGPNKRGPTFRRSICSINLVTF